MRVSDNEEVLELIGCVGCGDAFQTSSQLEIHLDTCPGLISGNEYEPSRYSNHFLVCARCPELDFVNRSELIRHLKVHRNQKRRRCVCRRRPCHCLKRRIPRRSNSFSGTYTRWDRDPSSSQQLPLCSECFDKGLQFGAKSSKCENCNRGHVTNPLQ
ncbi:uncharacterized protein LOC100905342 [Galendromus occidentalis]|uniref:Uncharacterized protein LOC100905342 n=1 Tax=Galendromus occidentalis TaxID=34638 RepID=A0AAJ6QV59_9ACAR|nr:uncharacterized protein LOC100905342 [Galendromus occidentalis]